MGIISKIEYQKKNKDRVSIFIDDEFAFGLHIDLVLRFSLAKGQELDEDFIKDVLTEEDKKKALSYCADVVSKTFKTEKELRDKLKQKEYTEDAINYAIDKLKEYHYIDDNYFANMYVKQKSTSSKVGSRMIKQKLMQKGVDKEIINNALEEHIDDELEFNNALELALKKNRSYTNPDTNKNKQKLSLFLQGKGFDFDIIKKVIHHIYTV